MKPKSPMRCLIPVLRLTAVADDLLNVRISLKAVSGCYSRCFDCRGVVMLRFEVEVGLQILRMVVVVGIADEARSGPRIGALRWWREDRDLMEVKSCSR